MRLEPVYVVAPRVASPSMPTRRAFLLASGTFAIGATLGGACGYAVGSNTAPESAAPDPAATGQPSDQPAVDEPLKPSGDVELDELRRLAVKAPIEELAEHRTTFLKFAGSTYRTDEILWRGVDRLSKAVMERRDFPNRRIAALGLAQVIEMGEPGLKKLLGDRVPALRAIK